jgi:hypothetical protein
MKREYVLNVDVRFHVDASSDAEAWKFCEGKTKQVQKLLKEVADDFVAADIWEYQE